jgi:hypothetical protein
MTQGTVQPGALRPSVRHIAQCHGETRRNVAPGGSMRARGPCKMRHIACCQRETRRNVAPVAGRPPTVGSTPSRMRRIA